jgi:hypothetical protein
MYVIVSRSCVALAAFVQTGTRPSSWHRACLLWLMIHWNPTAGVGLRHAMAAKYESFFVIGHRIRRVACGADLDASLQGDDLDGPGAADVFRDPTVDEQVAQPLENILAGEPLGDIDRQTLPSELVHDCQPSASGSGGHRTFDPRLGNSSRHGRDGSAAAGCRIRRSAIGAFAWAAF